MHRIIIRIALSIVAIFLDNRFHQGSLSSQAFFRMYIKWNSKLSVSAGNTECKFASSQTLRCVTGRGLEPCSFYNLTWFIKENIV
jgi:hypothetical protein